jgi:hypothetical protein
MKWKGPCSIVSVESGFVFMVENLLTKKTEEAQATCLRFYQKDKKLNDSEELAWCYALLRMRPLLNSWAECSVVISC